VPEVNVVLDEINADAEMVRLMAELKELFIGGVGGKKQANVLHVFHGTRVELVPTILDTGLLKLQREDEGFFGHGCYTTPSIEYAARYASGELCGDGLLRATDVRGCWPVVMFAAVVGVTYPVTRASAYPAPGRADGHSKYFGRALRSGVVDTHLVPVNRRHGFEACPVDEADYLEVVCSNPSALLPVAVLWLSK
jgi:hypothetical protein